MKFAKFSLSLVIGLIILFSFMLAMLKVFAVPIIIVVVAFVAFVIVQKKGKGKWNDWYFINYVFRFIRISSLEWTRWITKSNWNWLSKGLPYVD